MNHLDRVSKEKLVSLFTRGGGVYRSIREPQVFVGHKKVASSIPRSKQSTYGVGNLVLSYSPGKSFIPGKL